MRSLALAWAAGLLAIAAAPAAAFTAAPPGESVHDEITAIVRDAGWSAEATEALQQAVREPDYQDSEYDPELDEPARVDATDHYRPWHHCDREPGTADADAFNATVRYVHEQRREALNRSAAGDADGSMAALGRALHALQDCYSHSNIVDLPDQQRAFEQALLRGGPPVEGLRLVAYEPGADDPGRPGDDYGHDRYAKDSADQNDEARARLPDNRTKFEHAFELARLATVAFVQEFMLELGDGERASLLEVQEEDGGAPDDVNVPSLSLAAVLVAVAFASLPWRRR